ncbi:MAG TPA: Ig-like domain-containing protein [Bdellovibrionales bacterium]|nr:Ig-like domain-containing protein [Bdellovibrionales bacterium]
MIRKMWAILAWLVVTLVIPVQANAQYATGAVPNTPEQEERIKKTWGRVRDVKPNALGLERINQERKSKKQPLLNVEPAPMGQENTLAVGESSATMSVSAETPGAVDNSALPSFPLIRSQGSIGSCTSWAIVYYQLTHNAGLQRGYNNKTSDTSTTFSPKWTYNMMNGGENTGTSIMGTFNMVSRHGAARWSEWPYDSNIREWNRDPDVWLRALEFRSENIQYVSSVSSATGLAQAKALLNNGYVLTYATYINSWVYKPISDNPSSTADDAQVGKSAAYYVNGTAGGHMMTVVGYNDDIWVDVNGNGTLDSGELGAFRIANSWGAGWADGGYTWFAYDALKSVSAVAGAPSPRQVGFWDDRVYHMVVKNNYRPKIVGQFTLSHLRRNELSIYLGLSDLASSTPQSLFGGSAMSYMGGAFSFDGGTTEVAGSFVFDFTDLIPSGSTSKKYYLRVTDSAGAPVTVQDFRLFDVFNSVSGPAAEGLPSTFDGSTRHYAVSYSFNDGSPLPVAPNAPAGLSVAGLSSSPTSLNLTWIDNASNEDGFSIERSTDGTTFSAVRTVASNVTSLTETGLAADTVYYYRVRAYNAGGYSGYSNVGMARTAPPDTVAPSVSVTLAQGKRGMLIQASASDNVGVARVEIYVDGALVATDTSAPYEHTLNTRKLSAGTHTVHAVAYDGAGNGGVSAPVNFTK